VQIRQVWPDVRATRLSVNGWADVIETVSDVVQALGVADEEGSAILQMF
jgi:hypothetical protein